jgi:hypothetical protein
LRVRLLNGATSYGDLQTNGSYTNFAKTVMAIIISPEGKVGPDPTSGRIVCLQPGRPFFASAGPDGDFAKGDDNIYSFEP